ncbi:MAG: sigma-70 family RNA polymerase sigma factor [Sedimentisphaerales bacterium]|nr:sigma-70 family RNA polymerase sigma factor [Sedimentisphaerales bacterium]
MSVSEFLLLKRFAVNGDAEAFAEIVKQHAPLVYGVCLRILADKDRASDVVQDTFIQLVSNADTIKGSLPNWLHRVAKNRAFELIRQESIRKKHEKTYVVNSEKNQLQEKLIIWQEISGYIDEELDNLDDQMREVLILKFFEGLTTTEISKKCKISQPTVSRRLESGVGLLRHKLKSRGIVIPATVLAAMLTENIVKAAPVLVMKELGKIAIAGGHAAAAATGAKIGSSLTAGALKTKIIAISISAILIVGSIVIYNYKSRPKEPGNVYNAIPVEPTNIQQIENSEGIEFAAYSLPLNPWDINSVTTSDSLNKETDSPVVLVARIYNISDLAITDDYVKSIIALIKEKIEPDSWYETNKKAGGTIIAYNSKQTKNLTIRQSREVHEQIAELLKSINLSSGRNTNSPSEDLTGQINLEEILIRNDSDF